MPPYAAKPLPIAPIAKQKELVTKKNDKTILNDHVL
jgi:hypothetical protein